MKIKSLSLLTSLLIAACGSEVSDESVANLNQSLVVTFSDPTFRWAPIDATPWEWDGKDKAQGNRQSAQLFCKWKGFSYLRTWSTDETDPRPGRYRFSTSSPPSTDPTWCAWCGWKLKSVTCSDSPPTPPPPPDRCGDEWCSGSEVCCTLCDNSEACASPQQCQKVRQLCERR